MSKQTARKEPAPLKPGAQRLLEVAARAAELAPPAPPVRFGFIRSRRGRTLSAHRAVEPIVSLLELVADLAAAFAHETNDTRWSEVARLLGDAAELVRDPFRQRA